eukprot:9793831-Alexandrium_andersonii.AAC.1
MLDDSDSEDEKDDDADASEKASEKGKSSKKSKNDGDAEEKPRKAKDGDGTPKKDKAQGTWCDMEKHVIKAQRLWYNSVNGLQSTMEGMIVE